MNSLVPLIYLSMACVSDCRTICAVEIVSIYDGDTLSVNVPEFGHPIFTQNIGVRMLGVDAPEMDSKDPCEAKKALEARELTRVTLNKAKRINLQLMARDKYFRILADVVADGYSMGQKLLDAGLAWPYNGETKPKINWCGEKPAVIK